MGAGGVQDPLHGAVVHPDSGGDAVQRVAVVMGGEDRRNNLHGLPGRLGGDQPSGEMRGRTACAGALEIAVREA